LLRKQGIQVVSINEPIEDSPTGKLMEGIIEVIDEFYSSNLAQDITRGLRENASRGFFNGSRAAFGYQRKKVKDGDKERNSLEPNPVQVPIIQRIFNEIDTGIGLKEIAKGLNRDGVPSPSGGKWGKQRLHKILTNEVYTGRLVYGKKHKGYADLPPVVKDNAWAAIIDKTLFDKVQATMASRAPIVTHPRVTSSSYLLSGLIKCHKCGASYIGYGAKSGQFHYYVCGTTYSKGKDVCHSQHLPKEKIESYVSEKIKGYILTDDNLMKLIDLSNAEIGSSNRVNTERVDVIDNEIVEWQGRLERLYEFIETKSIEPERMAKRIKDVQDKVEELGKAKLQIEEAHWKQNSQLIDPQKVLSYVSELRDFIDEKGLFARRAFLRSFVKSIEADDDKMTFNYTLPLPPEYIIQETVSVLDIVSLAPPKSSKVKIGSSSIHHKVTTNRPRIVYNKY